MNAQPLKDSPTRLEPQSSEAEKAVLGSMLISKEAIPRAMSFLTEESFFEQKNRITVSYTHLTLPTNREV